jgi:carboxyl-terminal processing protease
VFLLFDDSTGYISLNKFSETSDREMKNALGELSQRGMKRLILDLRNNSGGLLEQARLVSDFFISDQKLIVSVIDRDSLYVEELFAEKSYPYENIPLIILVDRGSASASEIVAGAVQDWDRGIIVGEPTFGKGLVQRSFELFDNSAIRITVAKYYTPAGRAIQKNYQDRDEYYSNKNIPDQEVDNFLHNYEVDSTKNIFYTQNGRIMVDKEGIIPDFIVPYKDLGDVVTSMRSKNLFYKFARNYLEINSDYIKQNFSDPFRFREFLLSESDVEDIWKFTKNEIDTLIKKDFYTEIDDVKQFVKAFIARNLWRETGWYVIRLSGDIQFQKSVKLFDVADQLLQNDSFIFDNQ